MSDKWILILYHPHTQSNINHHTKFKEEERNRESENHWSTPVNYRCLRLDLTVNFGNNAYKLESKDINR